MAIIHEQRVRIEPGPQSVDCAKKKALPKAEPMLQCEIDQRGTIANCGAVE
jgi:hypothetical protein